MGGLAGARGASAAAPAVLAAGGGATSSAVGISAKSRSAALNDRVAELRSSVGRGMDVGAGGGDSVMAARSACCGGAAGGAGVAPDCPTGVALPECGAFFVRMESIVTSRTTAATITMTNNT